MVLFFMLCVEEYSINYKEFNPSSPPQADSADEKIWFNSPPKADRKIRMFA